MTIKPIYHFINMSQTGVNKVRKNETYMIEGHRNSIYGDSSDRLHVYSHYPETIFYPQREIVTTYDFKVAGNLMIEETSEIYALLLVKANKNMTSNTSPSDSVQVNGADAPPATEAWQIFDGVDTIESYSIPTGAGGVVDFTHTYEFDVPTRCYAIEMTTAQYTQAPAAYTVEASLDGSTAWIELLSINQGIAANDLKIIKYFDGALYEDYKAYRITVSQGNTELDFVSAKQYRLLKEDPNA